MTVPSLKYKCPKCGKEELHIVLGPHYCQCGGGKQTTKSRNYSGPVPNKMRKRTSVVGVRMTRIKF